MIKSVTYEDVMALQNHKPTVSFSSILLGVTPEEILQPSYRSRFIVVADVNPGEGIVEHLTLAIAGPKKVRDHGELLGWVTNGYGTNADKMILGGGYISNHHGQIALGESSNLFGRIPPSLLCGFITSLAARLERECEITATEPLYSTLAEWCEGKSLDPHLIDASDRKKISVARTRLMENITRLLVRE